MTTYYEVVIRKTAKAMGSKDFYDNYDIERKTLNTISEVKSFLHDTFGNCKREKMYQDQIAGDPQHIGYIYCYNTPKCSYDDVPHHNQDWVTVSELKAKTVIIK